VLADLGAQRRQRLLDTASSWRAARPSASSCCAGLPAVRLRRRLGVAHSGAPPPRRVARIGSGPRLAFLAPMRSAVLGSLLFTLGCGAVTSETPADAGVTNSSAPHAFVAEAAAGHAREAGDSGVGDAGCSSIVASNYDQTCTGDSDCIRIGSGDICSAPCSFICGLGGVINASDLPAYQADLARTGFSSIGVGCGCPSFTYGPCCIAGKCALDAECLAASADGSFGEAGADAGFMQCESTQACVGGSSRADWVCRELCAGPDGGVCPPGRTCMSLIGCCIAGGCRAPTVQVCMPSSLTDAAPDAPSDGS